MRNGRRLALISGAIALASLLAACTSDSSSTGTSTSAPANTVDTTAAPSTTVTTPGTDSTLPAPSTVPPTAAPTTTGAGGCPGSSGIPAGADIGTSITGDIDGDLADDLVTEYSLNGVPHVHSHLASGGDSDAEVPIGFADHVSISFEDFDYSLGAATKPPVAVLAVGATKAGTAVYTFLTNNIHYCIEPWHDAGGAMWVGRLSAEGPYEGLSCETAAGSRYYAVNQAVQQPGGDWKVTQTVFHHNFTKIVFDAPLPTFTVPDGPDVQHQYGDFFACDHAPLFP